MLFFKLQDCLYWGVIVEEFPQNGFAFSAVETWVSPGEELLIMLMSWFEIPYNLGGINADSTAMYHTALGF